MEPPALTRDSYPRPVLLLIAILFLQVWAPPSRGELGVIPQLADGQSMKVTGEPRLTGAAQQDAELLQLVEDDTPHGAGFAIVTRKQPAHHYDIEVKLPLSGTITPGDTLFASFWARSKSGARYETGEGYTLFRIQQTQPPWKRGLYREWILGPEWKQYYVAERFDHEIAKGQIIAAFSGGYPPQHIEIVGLEVTNLGPEVDPLSLPAMNVSYQGSEPDAEWRKQALQRIEQIRKADLTIEVVDSQGNPIPDADVRVQMTRHAFEFGAAISAKWLNQHWETESGQKYRQMVLEHFNSVAIENALKWSAWENDPDVALRTLRWAKEHDLRVHGHVLVWPGLEKFRVTDASRIWAEAQENPQVLRDRISRHIESILTETRGMVDVWDVVNEAYNQNDFIKLLGEAEIAEWFKLAEKHAPGVQLMYNDFGLLGSSGTNRLKHQFVIDLINGVRERGGRVDQLGLQSHLGNGLTPPPRVLDIIDRFSSHDINIKITEYDLNVDDPELAQQYTEDFLIAIFSHPAVTGFQAWNFWSATPTWMPEASYFGADWKPLPVGRAYLNLVRDQWWTEGQFRTDERGQVKIRGFLGEYEVNASDGDDLSVVNKVRLDSNGQLLKISLDQ